MQPKPYRAYARNILTGLWQTPASDLPRYLTRAFGDDAVFDMNHPINSLSGVEAILTGFVAPMKSSFAHLYRRDELFIGGPNRRESGGTWIAAFCHYVGTFVRPFLGISPTDRLVFLRSGEFYRVDGDRITQARIILDLPDLMRQAGGNPFPAMLGTEITFPGPATHDGVCPQGDQGEASLDLIEAMIRDLHLFNPETGYSANQTGQDGYWAEDMMWYGPTGIGSNYRWEGFVKDHRQSFLTAFPDRKGGNHFCRIGDANYAAFSGWPSMTMTHQGDYLGVPASGKPLSLRVMDFYRCAHNQIAENWVMLDYMELFESMGVDLIARSEAIRRA